MVQQCIENIMNIQEAYMYIHCHVTSVTAVPGLIPLNSHTQCFTATEQNQIVIRHDRCDRICNSIQTHVVNNSFAREQLIEDSCRISVDWVR